MESNGRQGVTNSSLSGGTSSLTSSLPLENEHDDQSLPQSDRVLPGSELEANRVSHKTKSYGISIDSSRIRAIPAAEQSAVLRDLKVDVFNQEEFEQGVLDQVDEAIAVRETEELCKGWEKELAALNEDIRSTEQEIKHDDRILGSLDSITATSSDARRKSSSVGKHKENKLQQLKKLQAKQKSLRRKLGLENEDQTELQEEDEDSDDCSRLKILRELNAKREQLIKLGQMTPFGTLVNQQENKDEEEENSGSAQVNKTVDSDLEGPSSRLDVGRPLLCKSQSKKKYEVAGDLFGKKKRVRFAGKSSLEDDSDDEYIPDDKEMEISWLSDEQVSDSDRMEGHQASAVHSEKVKYKKRRLNVEYVDDDSDGLVKKVNRKQNERMDRKPLDDGNYKNYRERIRLLRIKKLMKMRGEEYSEENDDVIDFTDNEGTSDMEFDGRLKIPGQVWHKLYKYQQTGVKWLWELHCQQAGGIVGDEMGLGKTIQMIVFLAGMRYSKISAKKSRHSGLGPVLIVCPVTVLHQWVKEFHKWSPEFRVAVLHDTGSYQGPRDVLIKKICQEPGVLLTSYSGMRTHQESLLAQHWDYIILDEGHKIRNPDAEITLACKQFRTPHRVILSGSPMQNNFRELWSLLDFVFPGKLGTLPVFMTEFSVPITMGGYANASDVQVQTAYKCACVLRDTINPYLLRRLKKDVKMALDLPNKNEQVLFCRLSNEQRQLYEEYLDSREVQSILGGNYKVFPGLIMLRKICNHPDLTSAAGSLLKAKEDELKAERALVTGEEAEDEDEGYGDWRRAGKMHVVEALLRMWKEQGNRVLLFSQSKQMLNILETFVQSEGYTYRRMDGGTSVASRQPLVNKFNEDESIFVFLLTTRVGGLGVNLVGADRVIIYDPDWNPSTDIQARERAWRIGQKKDVTIYRLLTTGTIEEKIYHRQIFKQFLTNRVLKDPKQRRFFKNNDLYELFTLDTSDKRGPSETSALFAGTGCEVKVPGAFKRKKGQAKGAQSTIKRATSSFSSGNSRLIKKTGADCSRVLSTRRLKIKEKKPERKATEQSSFEEDGGFAIDERDKKEIESELTTKNTADRLSPLLNTEAESMKLESTYLPSAESSESSQVDLNKTAVGDKVERASEAPEPNNVSGSLKPDASLKTPSKPEVSGLQGSCSQKDDSVCEPGANEQKLSLGLRDTVASGTNVASGNGKKELTTSVKELQKRRRIKKKRKRKEKKVEGRPIDYVVYKEQYRSSAVIGSGSSADERDKIDAGHQEKFILKNLFKQTGVHSALKHDVIMESGDPDHTLVESEANRVAKQAAVALKRSRQRCLSAASGIPTWTGVSGSSGISDSPPPRPRFGQRSTLKKTAVESKASTSSESKPLFGGDVMGLSSANPEDQDQVSSSQLLSKMRVRNNMIAPPGGAASGAAGTENDELIVQIRNFIAFRCDIPGQATTQEVLGEFGSRLPSSNSAVFRSMLRQICDFTRNDDGKGVWKLKEEFT